MTVIFWGMAEFLAKWFDADLRQGGICSILSAAEALPAAGH